MYRFRRNQIFSTTIFNRYKLFHLSACVSRQFSASYITMRRRHAQLYSLFCWLMTGARLLENCGCFRFRQRRMSPHTRLWKRALQLAFLQIASACTDQIASYFIVLFLVSGSTDHWEANSSRHCTHLSFFRSRAAVSPPKRDDVGRG